MRKKTGNSFKFEPISRRTFLKCTLAAAAASCLDPVLLRKAAKAQGPRVVVVYDNDCTTYDSGLWWGATAYNDQTKITNMVKEGVKNLTGQQSEAAAWESLTPTYSSGNKIGIKVNENNLGAGPSSNVIDWSPYLINGIISGLKIRGVAESDIWVMDPSGDLPYYTMVRGAYPGVVFYSQYGGTGRNACTWTPLSGCTIDHSDPSITDSYLCDEMESLTYLIHCPILKAHGYGVTLTYKNLLGLLRRSTIPRIHNYIQNASNNPLIDIYDNSNIKDKTILVVGDGIYGDAIDNYTAPNKWSVYGNGWPKRIFLGTDPVAVDSVMYDYIDWENSRTAQHENYLVAAANAGHGTRDHWNNPTDKTYAAIDFVQIDMENPNIPPASPTNLRISGI